MKLLRIGELGLETPCVLDNAGVARDVSDLVGDDLVSTLQGVDLASLDAIQTQGARFGSPISQPKNIYCIGLNYSDHAKEAGMAIPEEPFLFDKSSGAFCGLNDPTPYTQQVTKLDWEIKLGMGSGNKPPKFLKIGDEVHLDTDGLGEARQLVAEFTGA